MKKAVKVRAGAAKPRTGAANMKAGVVKIKAEAAMEKETDIFEAWFQSQRDFMENMLRAQQELMSNRNMFDSLVNQMVNSTKVYTNEVMKMQDAWRNTLEKQVEIGTEITRNLFSAGRKAA